MTLTRSTQLPLIVADKQDKESQTTEWGTFKDSLKAPIHNWFTYPAGFSYKAVVASLRASHIAQGDFVYDPFMGSGTTNVTAKKLGINSFGVEAHPFVFRIARTKLNWEISRNAVVDAYEAINAQVKEQREHIGSNVSDTLSAEFPELILKCYEGRTLLDLLLIRNAIIQQSIEPALRDLLQTCLTGLLRQVSTAATGWPYIAPKKKKTTSNGKDALSEYARFLSRMVADIETTVAESAPNYASTLHHLFNADCRDTTDIIPETCIDHVFTSPPYLNNFDYADRTRLEMYFFGEAKTWNDITRNVRTKLITSATTQIFRDDPRYILSEGLARDCPEIYDYLSDAVSRLSALRLTKGGKKSYDCLVSGYFNDMYQTLTDIFRVLKPGKKVVVVLGDSAPYGVHIPTDDFIGKIGIGVGFSDYKVDVLRYRGGKWRNNPQRHTVALKESIVTLIKE